jgi:hypothetical protein
MAETVISWVASVLPGRLTELRGHLSTIGAHPGTNDLLPFSRLSMLHFASLILFDEGAHADRPILVFESNIDPPYCDYAEEVVRIGRGGVVALFACCDGYPGAANVRDEDLVAHLARLRKRPGLFHIGHPNRSVQEIKGDYELRRSIAHALETDPGLRALRPADLRAEVRRRATCPHPLWPLLRPWHPSWASGPVDRPTPLGEITWERDRWPWGRLWRFFQLAFIGWLGSTAIVMFLEHYPGIPHSVTIALLSLAAFVLLRYSSPDAGIIRGGIAAGVLAVLLVATFRVACIATPNLWLMRGAALIFALVALVLTSYLNVMRGLESTKPFPPLDPERLRTLLDAEDRHEHGIYNHVAGLSVLKPRFLWIRRLRTRLALFVLNLFYRTQFVQGKLLTIPSIHFAQWNLVDGRHLLFVTNYEGGADSYLDDFFNSLARGVGFIWYDTVRFPATTDPRRLKVWVRQGQTLASVRYRAAVYDGLTVGVINNNTYIRTRLLRGHGQASARRWLRRFAASPVEPSVFWRFFAWLGERLRLTN